MRRLAQVLSVDKATVCRALSAMQDEGLVRRRGRRLHVSDEAVNVPDQVGVLGGTVLVVTAADLQNDAQRRDWLAQVIEGLLGEAHAQHCNTMVLHPNRLDSELSRLAAARPIGFALLGVNQADALVAQIEETGLPLVLYGDEVEAHGHDMVGSDHQQGTRELTRWLIGRGARRILRFWPHRSNTLSRPIWLGHRDQGYEQALAEAGLPVLPPLEYRRPLPSDLSPAQQFDELVREVAGRLVEHMVGPQAVDAIMTPADGFVSEVAAACRLFGKRPNQDVLIAGYDNNWDVAKWRAFEATPPAVTTAHDTVHLGQILLQTLLHRAKNPDIPPQRVAIPLTVRCPDPALKA